MARFFSGYIEGKAIRDGAKLKSDRGYLYFDIFYQDQSQDDITIHVSKSLIDDPKYLFKMLEELIDENKNEFVFNGTISYAAICDELLKDSVDVIGSRKSGGISSGEFHSLNNKVVWTKLSRKNLFRGDVEVCFDESQSFEKARGVMNQLDALLIQENDCLSEYLLDHLQDLCKKIS